MTDFPGEIAILDKFDASKARLASLRSDTSIWNHDISTAPRDGSQFLMATTDGKRFLTRWLEPTKGTPAGRFDGFPEKSKTLLAWCGVLDHPNSPAKASTGAVTGWVDPPSTKTGSSDLQDATLAETNGGNTRDSRKDGDLHDVFLDDVGSGA